MPTENARPAPIHTARPWTGIFLLAGFAAFATAMMVVATRVMLPQKPPADPMLPVFLGFMWLAPLFLGGLTIYHVVKALRHGRATLQLDAPARVGNWLSGVIDVPESLHGGDIELHLDCIKTSRGVDRGSLIRLVKWRASSVLDSARLERKERRLLIPFAIRIAETPPPTMPGDDEWVDWLLRVEARRAGVDYAEELNIEVLPLDTTLTAPAAPPRAMPELSPTQLANRLDGAIAKSGDATIIHLPFPRTSTTLLVVCMLITVAMAAPGMPWTSFFNRDTRFGAVVVGAGASAVMLLIVLVTPRRIEIGPERVRVVRGLFDRGFHSTIATGDVVAVEETSTTDAQATSMFYGVRLRTRDGKLQDAAMRLRDPALAKAIAQAIESRLPRGT